MSVDDSRLVELFESTLQPDDEYGINSFAAYEQMIETQKDVNLAAAFTMLAMALQKKKGRETLAKLAYHRVLLLVDEELENEKQRSVRRRKLWEKCSIYQQICKLLITKGQQKDLEEAEKMLKELLDYVPDEDLGSSQRLFESNGEGFHFDYTREEFIGQIHKMLTRCYHDMGRDQEAKAHYNIAINCITQGGTKVTKDLPADVQRTIVEHQAKNKIDWVSPVADDVKIVPMEHAYSWDSSANNGTVTVYIPLPDGVESSEQIKYTFPDSESVLLRFRTPAPSSSSSTASSAKTEHRLVLAPFRNEVNAEDTVAKVVTSKKGGKKYSLLLFVKDRQIKRWGSTLLKDGYANKWKSLMKAKDVVGALKSAEQGGAGATSSSTAPSGTATAAASSKKTQTTTSSSSTATKTSTSSATPTSTTPVTVEKQSHLPTLEDFDKRALAGLLPTPQGDSSDPLKQLPTAADVPEVDYKAKRAAAEAARLKRDAERKKELERQEAENKKKQEAENKKKQEQEAEEKRKQIEREVAARKAEREREAQAKAIEQAKEKEKNSQMKQKADTAGGLSGGSNSAPREEPSSPTLVAKQDPTSPPEIPSWASGLTLSDTGLLLTGLSPDADIDIDLAPDQVRFLCAGAAGVAEIKLPRAIDLEKTVAKRKKKKGTLEIVFGY
ncbi:unnamed protein product [Amoebophrya sp. A25]|nr:unnamed protein product [Amoebophrya sp. A25]|eukprot:GSA25T00007018001.1